MHFTFVSPYGYSLYRTDTNYRFGGSEVRSQLFATALASNPKLSVSTLVFDHGQTEQVIQGVCVKPIKGEYGEYAPPSRLRSLYYRFKPIIASKLPLKALRWTGSKLTRALQREQHNLIICSFGVNPFSWDVVSLCRNTPRLSAIFLGSYLDLEPNPVSLGSRSAIKQSRRIRESILREADVIVVQTPEQKQTLKNRYGREGLLIPNPIFFEKERTVSPSSTSPYFLWIGKSNKEKNPKALLELAKATPECHYRMVFNRSNLAIHQAVLDNLPSNIEVIEQIPREELNTLFGSAQALINTSVVEGFPNSFLEAGRYNVPIISLHVDPGAFIKKSGGGVACNGELEIAIKTVKLYNAEPMVAQKAGAILRHYTKTHHEGTILTKTLQDALISKFKQKLEKGAFLCAG